MKAAKTVIRRATAGETAIIEEILDNTRYIRVLAGEREDLYKKLAETAAGVELVAYVGSEDGPPSERESRVFAVGRPKGRYVFFPELDFVTNRKAKPKEIGAAQVRTKGEIFPVAKKKRRTKK